MKLFVKLNSKIIHLQTSAVVMLLGLGIMTLFLISCSPPYQPRDIPLEKQCTQDSDCVPAQCCHATDTVNKEFAPDCQEQFCTMECVPKTLDCAQGQVKCMNNECLVQFTESSVMS